MKNLEAIQQQVSEAKQLKIIGGLSQAKTPNTDPSINLLNMSKYSGVVEYHPEELVITIKAGTTVNQLNKILSENEQATSFVLKRNQNSTIGGAYAMGNSDLRDAVLGIKIIDGKGRILSFGGQVMKNVAGYDVARLLAGSRGKMAVICEISFKIIPQSYVTNCVQQTPILIDKSCVIKTQLEKGIKDIFDPLGIFV